MIIEVVSIPESSPNPPIIHPIESHTIVVSESENVGNLVAMIQAEDPDSDTLWYSISGKLISYYIVATFLIVLLTHLLTVQKLLKLRHCISLF